MNKRITAIILCIVLFLGISGCKNTKDTESQTETTVSVTSQYNSEKEKSTKPKVTTARTDTTTAVKNTDKTTAKRSTAKAEKTENKTVKLKYKKQSQKQKTTKTTTAADKTHKSPENITCIITIECKTILDNMADLKAGHESYVPKDGYILKNYECTLEKDDTVYDVLKRSCKENDIKLTSQNSVYGAYVVGINNLDQFDCGKQSGWLYFVNSDCPGVSCDNYKVSTGDDIVFSYTCKL